MKYTFIVNPNSRSGKGAMIWDEIQPELKKRNVDYEFFMTEYTGHASAIVRELTKDGQEHYLIALGGDGTVNEVVNGIMYLDRCVLGYIPTGSSNDFARGMHLPQDYMQALDVILSSSNIRKMDVGLVTRAGRERRFAVSTGIGFDAAICHQVAVSKLKVFLNKIKLGKLSYVFVALNRLFHDQPVQAEVYLDEEPVRKFNKMYFAAVMNHPYEGGGFYFCPKADVQDGSLDVIVVSGIPKLIVLLLLPTAYKGLHVHFPGVTVLQGKKVRIKTSRSLAVHTDGEPLFLRREITAKLLPEQLSVFV